MAISRMFSHEDTQLSVRDRSPDPNWQNLSTTFMQKCEKIWVNVPSSHREREAQIRGVVNRQHQDGEQQMDTTRTGLGGKREWGFGRVEHLEGGKKCDLREKGQIIRGKKLDLFRWKIKIKRKGRSKIVMINSMGEGYNQLLFPGHRPKLLSGWRFWCSRNKSGEHKHCAPRPVGTAWEFQKQHHVKGTNKVWSRDRMDRSVLQPRRWQAEPAAMGREKLRAQKGDRDGFTWLQTGEGTHLDLHKHEQDCSWEEKARFKERKGWYGWVGQQNRSPRFKKYTVHFGKNEKAAFKSALNQ